MRYTRLSCKWMLPQRSLCQNWISTKSVLCRKKAIIAVQGCILFSQICNNFCIKACGIFCYKNPAIWSSWETRKQNPGASQVFCATVDKSPRCFVPYWRQKYSPDAPISWKDRSLWTSDKLLVFTHHVLFDESFTSFMCSHKCLCILKKTPSFLMRVLCRQWCFKVLKQMGEDTEKTDKVYLHVRSGGRYCVTAIRFL